MKDEREFLEAYRKPSELYKFLECRFIESPYFLARNLSYRRIHAAECIEKRPNSYRKLSGIFPQSQVRQKDLNRNPSRLHISLQASKSMDADYVAVFSIFQPKNTLGKKFISLFSGTSHQVSKIFNNLT